MLHQSYPLIAALVIALALFLSFGCGQADDAGDTAANSPTEVQPVQNDDAVPSQPAPQPSPAPADPLSEAAARHAFSWLGQDVDAALTAAKATEQAMRVVRRDGEDLPTTRDSRPGRLNLWVQDGRIMAVLREAEGGGNELIEGVSKADLLPFIGLSAAESEAAAATASRPWRVIRQDGEHFAVTMDYLEERVNAVIVEGVVVAASDG